MLFPAVLKVSVPPEIATPVPPTPVLARPVAVLANLPDKFTFPPVTSKYPVTELVTALAAPVPNVAVPLDTLIQPLLVIVFPAVAKVPPLTQRPAVIGIV